jgi:hypothetical protein
MKLQIIHLEPHEDLSSAKDRLAWAKAERVLFMWPRHGQILQRQLDLVLLGREAVRRGLQLGLLTHDPVVRDHAQRVGITVFDELEQATREDWATAPGPDIGAQRFGRPDTWGRSQDKLPYKRSHPVERTQRPWLAYLSLALALFSIASLSFVLLPSASIRFQPLSLDRQATMRVTLNPLLDEDEISVDGIPASMHQVEISVEIIESATGTKRVPTGHAGGELLFTNLTDHPVEIPAGTSVRIAGQEAPRFEVASSISLSQAEGSQAVALARSANPGPEGNVDAEVINAVDGPLGLSVAVTNPGPFGGGDLERQTIVAQEDLDRALATATEQILEAAGVSLTASLPAGRVLVPASLRISSFVNVESDRALGAPAMSFRLASTAVVEGLSYRPVDAQRALNLRAESSLPALWELRPNSVSSTEMTVISDGPGGQAVLVTGSWEIYNASDLHSIPLQVHGLTRAEAEEVLESEFGVREIDIEIRPAILDRLPLLPARIDANPAWDLR